jgi:hypothetical protein
MTQFRRFARFAVLGVIAAGALAGQIHLPGTSPGSPTKPTPSAPPAKPPAQAPVAPAAATQGDLDYFILTLSVQSGRILVKGFRAQPGEGPCGTVKPAPRGAIRIAESLMASQPAMREEWTKHGSCTGFTASEYFNTLRFARSLVQIPVQLISPDDDAAPSTPKLIVTDFVSANPGFPAGAFRADGTDVEVCFDPNIKPRACEVTGSK